MSDMFYRAFEERHRGSFELIRSRLNIYLPFILPLKKFNKKPTALDLGCGRGEWLDLLQTHGFEAVGVDLNEGMLQACCERNLNTVHGDAIAYIKNLPANSLDLVSAFHFVEHIPFEGLQELTREAYRVLKPGGLLILETPNSENLQVGTSSFYLDPTHKQPLPSLLLSFVLEYSKFERVKSIFLQEPYPLSSLTTIGLQHILEGVSCDYAIVSQKQAAASMLTAFDAPFNRDYGTRLIPLAKSYDKQIENWQKDIEIASETISDLCNRVKELEATIVIHEQKQIQVYTILNELLQNKVNPISIAPIDLTLNKQKFQKISAKLKLLNIATIPVNKIKAFRHKLRSLVSNRNPKQIAIFIAKKILKKVLSNYAIKDLLLKIINRYPRLKQRLRQFAIRTGALNLPGSQDQRIHQQISRNNATGRPIRDMSPRTNQIYNALQEAIENKEKSHENSY